MYLIKFGLKCSSCSLSFWMFWVSWCLAAITNKSHHQKEMESSRQSGTDSKQAGGGRKVFHLQSTRPNGECLGPLFFESLCDTRCPTLHSARRTRHQMSDFTHNLDATLSHYHIQNPLSSRGNTVSVPYLGVVIDCANARERLSALRCAYVVCTAVIASYEWHGLKCHTTFDILE